MADTRLRAEHYEIAQRRGGLEDRSQKSHRTTDMSSICDYNIITSEKILGAYLCLVIFFLWSRLRFRQKLQKLPGTRHIGVMRLTI